MSAFLNGLKNETNFGYTENGAVKHNSTLDHVLDMFSMGGAYRNRTDKEVEALFGDAYRQDKNLAMKCLFYLRDVRGGQGERRFFRVAYRWLIKNDVEIAAKFLNVIPEFGRWDDLIKICYNTPLVSIMGDIVHRQLLEDTHCEVPSLLGKWMPSENASSTTTKEMARYFMKQFNMSPKTYRKILSSLREKINVLERLMSENRWDEIQFDKIPSVAGMKYRNAFAVKEVTAARYKAFMESKTTKVNAAVLNPVDIVDKILYKNRYNTSDDVFEETMQKYWDNLKDYYCGREENAIAVVDVSGSMYGTPVAAAVGMGAYVAEKSHGPFAGHFITFSANPQLVEFEGDNIVDKVNRCVRADWGMNTNLEKVFELILTTALKTKASQTDLPARLYIFSDMEFDAACGGGYGGWRSESFNGVTSATVGTLLERMEKKFNAHGYQLPKVTFWNLDARTNNIPAIGDSFNYISGFSMSQMEAVMAGLTATDMMLKVLLADRYEVIKVD